MSCAPLHTHTSLLVLVQTFIKKKLLHVSWQKECWNDLTDTAHSSSSGFYLENNKIWKQYHEADISNRITISFVLIMFLHHINNIHGQPFLFHHLCSWVSSAFFVCLKSLKTFQFKKSDSFWLSHIYFQKLNN